MRHARTERGATVAEYAMGVALIVVASLGAISVLEDESNEQVDTSAERIGMQDDDAFYGTGGGGGAEDPGDSTPPPEGEETSIHLDPSPDVNVAADGNKRWRVTVSFTILDESGNGVIGASIEGSWTDGGGGSKPVTTCSTDNSSGECTVQFTNIRDDVTEVTFDVDEITGENFQWTPQTGTEGTVVVSCGSVC